MVGRRWVWYLVNEYERFKKQAELVFALPDHESGTSSVPKKVPTERAFFRLPFWYKFA